jgi:tetratricopeptide (TPR) repeat protein
MKFFIWFFLITVSLPAFAQDPNEIQEQKRKTEILREMDAAVALMENGQYEEADQKFRFVLQNIRAVPSDLTYYFGKNSFYLEDYKQSIDWLNKYIQLKGTSGQFYNDATTLLKKAEENYLKTRSQDVKKTEEVLSKNYDIDCGPGGKAYCPVCKGDHVIVKKGPFGDEFKTCPYCDDHGLLSCEDYNKLLRGELKKKQ